jgi:hypothetical protein
MAKPDIAISGMDWADRGLQTLAVEFDTLQAQSTGQSGDPS